jgi:lipopolysaccharide export system protein LptC
MIRRVLAAALVIAIIVAAWLVLDRAQNAVSPLPRAVPAMPTAGYSARQAEIIETGPDGRATYTVRAGLIRQLPDEQSVFLDDLQMQFRDEAGQLWDARAAHGRILEDSTQLDLRGDVVLSGLLGGEPARLTTEQLALDTHTEIATTKEPVLIDRAGLRLTAQGLDANLKDLRVRLESSVHGSYKP